MTNKTQGTKPVCINNLRDLGVAFTRVNSDAADLADAWETVEAIREFMDSLVIRPHGKAKAYFLREDGKLRRISYEDVKDHVNERRQAHQVILAHTDWVEVEGRLMRPEDVPARHYAEKLWRAATAPSNE